MGSVMSAWEGEEAAAVHTLARGENLVGVLQAVDDKVQRLQPAVMGHIAELDHLDFHLLDDLEDIVFGELAHGLLQKSNVPKAGSSEADVVKDIKIDKDGKEWIVKDRIKTGVPAFIPILPVVKEILVKYNYYLPTLSNQKYNSYLKEIQEVCGITKTLHSHLARHTCGTLLLNAGVDMLTVSKVLGHSSTKTTEAVYAKLLPETIMKRVEEVSDKLM